MKNAAYFQETRWIKSRSKDQAIRPKQVNLFYLSLLNANFDILNNKQKRRFISEVNRLFGDDLRMIEHWSEKLHVPMNCGLLCMA